MAYCCVPKCTSFSKNDPGISFHEIPSKSPLREQWIKSISRRDWVPNDTSNYSRVCRKHFLPEDYLQGLKVRRLKPDVIPSVFNQFPLYMQTVVKKRDCSALKKRSGIFSEPVHKRTRLENSNPCASEVGLKQTLTDLGEKADVCVQVDFSRVCFTVEPRRHLNRKIRDLKHQLAAVQSKLHKCNLQLTHMKEDYNTQSFLKIVEDADNGNKQAEFLVDQVKNYHLKRPSWTETTVRNCIIFRNISPQLYERIRVMKLLKLPCRTTLANYIGDTSGQTGVSDLVKARLQLEFKNLRNPQSQVCSLVIDEMRIKEKLQYHRQRDVFLGDVDVGEAQDKELELSSNIPTKLANSLLCFLINGLSVNYRIPVAYYFTNSLSCQVLANLIIFVLKEVTGIGFRIIRVVTDNLSVNTAAMKLICNGELRHEIDHPSIPGERLF